MNPRYRTVDDLISDLDHEDLIDPDLELLDESDIELLTPKLPPSTGVKPRKRKIPAPKSKRASQKS